MSPQHKYWIIGLITVVYSLTEIGWLAGYFFSLMDMAPSMNCLRHFFFYHDFMYVRLYAGFIGILGGIIGTGALLTGFVTPVILSVLTPNVIKDFRRCKHFKILIGSTIFLNRERK